MVTRLSVLAGTAVVAGLVAFAIADIPAAQAQVPNGSYQRSCSNARVVDGTLEADCLTADQQSRPSALPHAFNCRGDIANINGRLQCSGGSGHSGHSGHSRTSAHGQGTATFSNNCGSQQRFIVVRVAGSSQFPFAFILDPGMRVHTVVAQHSTWAAQCGRYPDLNGSFRHITLD